MQKYNVHDHFEAEDKCPDCNKITCICQDTVVHSLISDTLENLYALLFSNKNDMYNLKQQYGKVKTVYDQISQMIGTLEQQKQKEVK